MEVTESEDTSKSKRSRIRYTRDEIIALKDSYINLKDVEICRITASLIKSNKQSKQCSLIKAQTNDRRDTANIVLGPQKRTWNTGCHVSQPQNRENNDSNSNRWTRHNSENRTSDKTYSKNDYRKDFRSNDSRGQSNVRVRDRGFVRRTDSKSGKEDNFQREHRTSGSFNEEPEWFSEGPETVNDTIELGAFMEDNSTDRIPERKILSEKNHSSVTDFEPKSVSDIENGIPMTTLEDIQTEDVSENCSSGQGSRFKYLFKKQEVSAKTEFTGNINDHLMKLLRGPHNVMTPDGNDVIQVENKLRSILLCCPSNTNNVSKKEEKKQVLTLEEVEARLIEGCDAIKPTQVRSSRPECFNNTDPSSFKNVTNQFPNIDYTINSYMNLNKNKMNPEPMDLPSKPLDLFSNMFLNSTASSMDKSVNNSTNQLELGSGNNLKDSWSNGLSDLRQAFGAQNPQIPGNLSTNSNLVHNIINFGLQKRPIVKSQQTLISESDFIQQSAYDVDVDSRNNITDLYPHQGPTSQRLDPILKQYCQINDANSNKLTNFKQFEQSQSQMLYLNDGGYRNFPATNDDNISLFQLEDWKGKSLNIRPILIDPSARPKAGN